MRLCNTSLLPKRRSHKNMGWDSCLLFWQFLIQVWPPPQPHPAANKSVAWMRRFFLNEFFASRKVSCYLLVGGSQMRLPALSGCASSPSHSKQSWTPGLGGSSLCGVKEKNAFQPRPACLSRQFTCLKAEFRGGLLVTISLRQNWQSWWDEGIVLLKWWNTLRLRQRQGF